MPRPKTAQDEFLSALYRIESGETNVVDPTQRPITAQMIAMEAGKKQLRSDRYPELDGEINRINGITDQKPAKRNSSRKKPKSHRKELAKRDEIILDLQNKNHYLLQKLTEYEAIHQHHHDPKIAHLGSKK